MLGTYVTNSESVLAWEGQIESAATEKSIFLHASEVIISQNCDSENQHVRRFSPRIAFLDMSSFDSVRLRNASEAKVVNNGIVLHAQPTWENLGGFRGTVNINLHLTRQRLCLDS